MSNDASHDVSGKYFATFISGCQQIIDNRLKQFAKNDLSVQEIYDGLVVFNSSLSIEQLSELRFFNNVYELVVDLNKQNTPDEAALALQNADLTAIPRASFKVSAQFAGKPIGLEGLNDLQNLIVRKTGSWPDSFKPVTQLLLVVRADGRALFGKVLPKAGFKLRPLSSGELRFDLAHILGLVASLSRTHVVLDAFAGNGAIARECLQGFHCEKVIAFERDAKLIAQLKSIPQLTVIRGDARRLNDVQDGSIDRVITDPPWGKYGRYDSGELDDLYKNALLQMHRVLRKKGCAVVLTAYEAFPEFAAEAGFVLEKQHDILVSGKKASIFKLRKL
jgi:predicted RNA methylase